MGRFDATKATIDANIKSNGNQDITGDILNSVMKGMVDATDAELTELSEVIGGEDIEYNSSILVNQGLIASNGTIYTSSDYAAYSYSNPIKVKKGQRISVTVNQTAGAAAATLFDANDKPIRTLIPSAYVVATAETEIEDGVAYVRFCSANSASSVFKAFVEGGGFAKDLKQIQTAIDATNGQVAKLGTSVENINEKLLGFEQRKVGDFYQTAWVRASDGYISYSSGGAMTYIIYRDDIASATEVYARVCTENVIFAPIAFYSGVTPSTSNFISALDGVTDRNLHDFVGVIPEGCKSILVMNMSQYHADYDIRVNESEFVTRQELKGEDGTKETTPIFNPFAVKNQYYHFNQENAASETFIPAQSLYDIRLAAQLGFEWIEANAWPCSDGVFITKHGSGGAFGNGIKSDNGVDYSAKQINSVSSEEVRSHITYDSQIAKYCSPIPTLEEFLAECKKYNMGVKTNNQSGLLAVMRKYLTDDKIFISYMARGDFKGLLEVVYYPNEGYEKLEEKCNQTGYPLQVIIASGQFEGMSDDAVKAIVEWCHIRNYTVAVPYLSSMNWMRAQRLGVDVNLSCERTINPFLVGNDKNISSLSDSGIALSGSASYNADTDTIVMAKNSILTIAADNIRFGAVSADICYKGMVTIMIGHAKGVHSFVDIASDGNDVFSTAQAILPQNGEVTTDYYIKIYAKEDNTIIKDLSIRCSKL